MGQDGRRRRTSSQGIDHGIAADDEGNVSTIGETTAVLSSAAAWIATLHPTPGAEFGDRGNQSWCRSAHFAWSLRTLATIRSVAAGNQPRRF